MEAFFRNFFYNRLLMSGSARKLYTFLFLIVIIVLVKAFVFDFYLVTSESMEGTILKDDVIIVNKTNYGVGLSIENSLNVFFKGPTHDENNSGLNRGCGALADIRNNIVAFKHPEDGAFLIKRCVGLPGDVFLINHNVRYANGFLQPETPFVKYSYAVQPVQRMTVAGFLNKAGIAEGDLLLADDSVFHIAIAKNDTALLEKKISIRKNTPDDTQDGVRDFRLFPYYNQGKYGYSRENFGPVTIPARGRPVKINMQNILLYQNILEKFEHKKVIIADNKIWLDGNLVHTYTFKQNYFFMMGDNRYRSVDSRYWGFVPEENIIGKVSRLLFSFSREAKWDNKFRILKNVK